MVVLIANEERATTMTDNEVTLAARLTLYWAPHACSYSKESL